MGNETYVNPIQAAIGAASGAASQNPWADSAAPNKGDTTLDRNMSKLVESVDRSVTAIDRLDKSLVSRFDEFGRAIKTRISATDDYIDKKIDKLLNSMKMITGKVDDPRFKSDTRSVVAGGDKVTTLLDNISKHLEPISKNFEKFVEKMQSNVAELTKLEGGRSNAEKSPADKISTKLEEEQRRFTAMKESNVFTNLKGQMDAKVDSMLLGLTGKLTNSIGGIAEKVGAKTVGEGLKGVSEMAKSRQAMIGLAQQQNAEIIKSTGIQKIENVVGDVEPGVVESEAKSKTSIDMTGLETAVENGFDKVINVLESGSVNVNAAPSEGGIKPVGVPVETMAAATPTMETPPTVTVESAVKPAELSMESKIGSGDAVLSELETIFAGLGDDVRSLGEKIDDIDVDVKKETAIEAAATVKPIGNPIEAVKEDVSTVKAEKTMEESPVKGFVERAVEAMKVFTGELAKIKGDIAPNIKHISEVATGKTSVEPMVGKSMPSPGNDEFVKKTEIAGVAEETRDDQSMERVADAGEMTNAGIDRLADMQEKKLVADEETATHTKKFQENFLKTNKEIAASLVLTNKHLNAIDDTLWENEEEAKKRHKDDTKEKEKTEIEVATKESKVPASAAEGGGEGDGGGSFIKDYIQDKVMDKVGRGLGKLGRGLGRVGGKVAGRMGGLARQAGSMAGRVGGRVLGRAGMQVLARGAGALGPAAAVAATAYGGYQAGKYIGGKLEEYKPGDLQGKTAWDRASASDMMVNAMPIGQLGRATGLLATNEDIFQKQKADKEEAERLKAKLGDSSKAEVGGKERVDAKKVLQRHQLYEKLSISKKEDQERLDSLGDEEFNKEIKEKYGSRWFGRGSKAMEDLAAYQKNVDAAKKKEADLAANPPAKETKAEGVVEGTEKPSKEVPVEGVRGAEAAKSAEGGTLEMGKMAGHVRDLNKLQQENTDTLKQVGEIMRKAAEREPVQVTTYMDTSYNAQYNQMPYTMNDISTMRKP